MSEVKAVPYCLMALVKAVTSLVKSAWPAEAQRPNKSVVCVSMAAGMAEIGVSAVPPWIIVYKRAEVNSPLVPTKFFARVNSSLKSDCCFADPSVNVEP